MAETKKKPKPGPHGHPPAPTQSPGSTEPVHFPGTVSPVSLPVGATGPGLPAGINPLIAGSLNTPYWQQQLQQNPSSVLAAYSPPALNQLSQFYQGQNLGGSMANPTSIATNNPIMFAPAPQGIRPMNPMPGPGGPGMGQPGSPFGPLTPPPAGLRPAGLGGEPFTPPNSGPAGGLSPMGAIPQGGKGGAPSQGMAGAGFRNMNPQMGGKGTQPQAGGMPQLPGQNLPPGMSTIM